MAISVVSHPRTRLSFNISKTPDLYLKGITAFINRTCPKITKYDTRAVKKKITKYELRLISSGNLLRSSVDLGIKAAILRGVRDVILDLQGCWNNRYPISKKICSYASLESLTLRYKCRIKSSSEFNWTSLKALTLEFIYLKDDVIKNIMKGSPKLEYLELNQCRGFNQIIDADFTSCIRKLVIIQNVQMANYNNVCDIMTILMPKVECLILKLYQRLNFIDVSSLVDVALDFTSFDTDPNFTNVGSHYSVKTKNFANDWLLREEQGITLEERRDIYLVKLLYKLGHAKIVRLGTWCLKVISSYIRSQRRELPYDVTLPKCKCLVLENPVDGWDFFGLLDLIGSTPHLETLVLDLTNTNVHKEQSSTGNQIREFNAMTNLKMQDKFFLQHLKYVRIVGLSSRLFGVAQFFLQNAKFLETMALTKFNDKDDPTLVFKKIMQLPRSSPNAQVLIS